MYKITLLCLAGLVVAGRASVAPSPVQVVEGSFLDQPEVAISPLKVAEDLALNQPAVAISPVQVAEDLALNQPEFAISPVQVAEDLALNQPEFAISPVQVAEDLALNQPEVAVSPVQVAEDLALNQPEVAVSPVQVAEDLALNQPEVAISPVQVAEGLAPKQPEIAVSPVQVAENLALNQPEVDVSPVQVAEDSALIKPEVAQAVEILNAIPTGLSKNGLGISADVNDYVDSTIHMLKPFLQKHGLDPMDLPEVVEGFEVRPLLITYSAWLKIHNGKMTGLTQAERKDDQMVHYFANMLRTRIVLNFSDLLFSYDYLVKVMNIGPTGGIRATLDRYVVVVDVLIDFNNDEIHLIQFAITEIGRLRVRFVGNILTDWLFNSVISVFTRIFDTIIIKVVELNIRNAVNLGIAFINANIKEVINAIESFN